MIQCRFQSSLLPSSFSKESSCMTFIDEHESIILIGQIAYLFQWCHISVHRKDAISCDQFHASIARFELFFQIWRQFNRKFEIDLIKASSITTLTRHISVPIALLLCFTQTNPINDRCVIQFIGKNCIVWCEYHLENASVRIETWRIKNCVLSTMKLWQFLLQLL